MTVRDSRKLAGAWVYKHLQGSNKQLPDEAIGTFAKALLIATKGDNVISQDERDWVIGLTAAKGASEALLAELETYSGDEDVESLLQSNPVSNKSRRNLIYTAIQASDSDGTYNEGEKAAIRNIASKLGITEDVVVQLENLYQKEKELFSNKIGVLFPDGIV
jgi:tellurite resistance protein